MNPNETSDREMDTRRMMTRNRINNLFRLFLDKILIDLLSDGGTGDPDGDDDADDDRDDDVDDTDGVGDNDFTLWRFTTILFTNLFRIKLNPIPTIKLDPIDGRYKTRSARTNPTWKNRLDAGRNVVTMIEIKIRICG